jgi:hypothetical protein
MFQIKFVQEIETHFMFRNFFFESRAIYEIYVEKYSTARQPTYDNIIRRMRFACWITKATDTHSAYVIFYRFSTATVVTRTHLSVTFIRILPLLFK